MHETKVDDFLQGLFVCARNPLARTVVLRLSLGVSFFRAIGEW